ncbi:MAG: hypothetical protein AAGI52_03560 [Bacteroidota bacterium]
MKLSLFSLGLALTLALAHAPSDALAATEVPVPTPLLAECQTDTLPLSAMQGTLTIEYQQTRGDLRQASLSVVLSSESHEPGWHRKLKNLSVLTTTGQWILIESFRARDGGLEARAMLPPPNQISSILMIGELGTGAGWKVEEGEMGYTEIEWTYLNQRGQETEPPRATNSDDDDCGPIPAGCEVFNPWTCKCDIGLKDPFGLKMDDSSFRMDIRGFSFGVE